MPILEDADLIKLFELYEIYKKETLEGNYGKTAHFYMIHINLIDYYFMLNSSIRTANFESFLYVLTKLSNLLFIFNLQNYSVGESHPVLREQFEKGWFGIKRTDKPFSR